jgi:peptidoglycan/xylan/chitin deacetylase (PgdA/CDA1 family)
VCSKDSGFAPGEWARCCDQLAGVRPRGYRTPAWDNSPHTIALLEHGFRYESSLMGRDFAPYWCRVGDVIR